MVNSLDETVKFATATFERIKPIVLGFGPLSLPIRMNPRTIGLIRSKVAFQVFDSFGRFDVRKNTKNLRYSISRRGWTPKTIPNNAQGSLISRRVGYSSDA